VDDYHFARNELSVRASWEKIGEQLKISNEKSNPAYSKNGGIE
jgi:hypothetical protein